MKHFIFSGLVLVLASFATSFTLEDARLGLDSRAIASDPTASYTEDPSQGIETLPPFSGSTLSATEITPEIIESSLAPTEVTPEIIDSSPSNTDGTQAFTEPSGSFTDASEATEYSTPDIGSSLSYTTGGPSYSTTEVPPVDDIRRTVIFIHKETEPGHDLFIRGGIDSSVRPGCTANVYTDPCSIDISTNSLGTGSHYDEYDAWREGDTRLDWFGAEPGQGDFLNEMALGTPTAWTSNDPTNDGYQELNVYGDHYWMVDMDMNCTQNEDGWFEFKGYMNDNESWEVDIDQVVICSGTAGGITPYASVNHHGRCGYINVFSFDSSACRIENF